MNFKILQILLILPSWNLSDQREHHSIAVIWKLQITLIKNVKYSQKYKQLINIKYNIRLTFLVSISVFRSKMACV